MRRQFHHAGEGKPYVELPSIASMLLEDMTAVWERDVARFSAFIPAASWFTTAE
jgi:hypothetical protein